MQRPLQGRPRRSRRRSSRSVESLLPSGLREFLEPGSNFGVESREIGPLRGDTLSLGVLPPQIAEINSCTDPNEDRPLFAFRANRAPFSPAIPLLPLPALPPLRPPPHPPPP